MNEEVKEEEEDEGREEKQDREQRKEKRIQWTTAFSSPDLTTFRI